MKLNSVFAGAMFVAVTAITAIGFSSQAQGLTFSGNSSGKWEEPTLGSNTNPVYSPVGTNLFTWGQPLPDDVNFATPQNKLTFSGNLFSAEVNSVFKIGDLTYFNGRVLLNTNVASVPLNINLSFTEPINFSSAFNFDFLLDNTINTGIAEQDADTVSIKENFGDRTFTFDGNQYTLELNGFSQDGGETSFSLQVLEGQTATAGIFARITTVPSAVKIPEPASIAGLCLLSIYLIYRQKSLRAKSVGCKV